MEPFITTFSAIDKRGVNVITINELRNYVAENHLDKEMIPKWQSLFDPEGSGKITFRRFCEVLGVHPERPQVVISKPLYGIPTTGLRPEIFVIMQELPLQDQIKISEEAYRLTQPQDKFIEKEASEKLKRWLDTTYGRHWHVTIVRVDLDHDEKISMKDLKNYVETYNLDEKMIESWRKLFDPNRTGYITLAKFCDVLGVKMEEARKVREEIKRRSTNILPSDVYVIAQQMSITDQIQISDQARRLLFPPNELDNKEIAHSLKLWLHKVYGPIWHVVVIRGDYGASYTHSENRSFQFRLRNKCFLIWNTPDQ